MEGIREQKIITLKSLYGFGIYVPKEHKDLNKIENYVVGVMGRPALFGNRDTARHYAKTKLKLANDEFTLHVIKYNYYKNVVDLIATDSEIELIEPGLYLAAEKDTWYYIREIHIDTVQSIRYIQFGNKRMVEESYGKQMNNYFYEEIKEAATSFTWFYGLVDTIKETGMRELEISFKNSTARVYIMTNRSIAFMNMDRKASKETNKFFTRCLPFIKEMDNFMSFFTYVAKDHLEPEAGMGFVGGIDQDIEFFYQYIINYMYDYFDNGEDLPVLVPVKFAGTILIRR